MKLRDVERKVEYIKNNFNKLEKLKKYNYEELTNNFERVDSVIYTLQTSIEALLDIARYIIAELGLKIPSKNSEIIEILVENNFIKKDDMKKYIQMIGFKNRVVHEYNAIDYQLLYRILHKDGNNLKKLFKILLEIIKKYQNNKNTFKGIRFIL